MRAPLARVSVPELHLREVPRLAVVQLDISGHTFGAVWETEPGTVGERRAFTQVGAWSAGLHRELLASADLRTVYIISSLGSAWVGLFEVECQDWWIDPTQKGDAAYRLALPTKALRRARAQRIAARNRSQLEDDASGTDFALGLEWVCGLDEPVRQARRGPR